MLIVKVLDQFDEVRLFLGLALRDSIGLHVVENLLEAAQVQDDFIRPDDVGTPIRQHDELGSRPHRQALLPIHHCPLPSRPTQNLAHHPAITAMRAPVIAPAVHLLTAPALWRAARVTAGFTARPSHGDRLPRGLARPNE